MTKSSKQLGLRIKGLRESKKWTQRECSEYIGLNHTYLASVELGNRNVTLSNLEKIAEGFGITLEELFRGL